MTCRATPDSGTLPSAPVGLVANGTDSSVMLSWDANAVSEGVTAYKVYRGTTRGGAFVLKATVTTTSYEDATAVTATTYWYRVSAVNPAGEGDYTDVEGSFLADTTAPSDPSITSTTVVGPEAVKLEWTSPTDADLAGFNVYADTTNPATTQVNTDLISLLEYTYESATAGSTWYFKVTAVDSAGNESTGDTSNVAVPASDTTAPATPATPSAQVAPTGVLVTWTPNTEPDLASYKIYKSENAGAFNLLANPASSLGGSYTDTAVVSGSTYAYKILARDSSGNESAQSTASNTLSYSASATGSLSGFVQVGAMVPCVAHARAVGRYTYTSVTTGTGVTSVNVVTHSETEDFDALAAGSILTAKYEWDFSAGVGDAKGSYNQLRGWNGAHAYDDAGTYTIKLTRTDQAGKVEVYQSDITVAANTRTTVYVSSTGLGSGDGSTQATAVNLTRAAQILSSTAAVKLLFRLGDTFYMGSGGIRLTKANQMISTSTGWKLGTSTAKPIFGYNAPGSGARNLIVCETGATNFVIEGLNFKCSYSGGTLRTDYAIRVFGSTNGLIRNCDITKFGSFIEHADTKSVRYLLVQNCHCVGGDKSLKNSFTHFRGDDLVLLGCSMPNSRDEHCVRWGPSCRTLVAFCNFKNMQYNALASPWKDLDSHDIVKTTFDIQQGYHHYSYQNTLTCDLYAPQTAGTVQIGPLNETTGHVAEFVRYICFERNRVVEASMDIQAGCSDVMIRNNVITKSNGFCFEIQSQGSGVDENLNSYSSRTATRVYLLNNTCYNLGVSGQLLRMKNKAQTLVIKNNLFIGETLESDKGTADGKVACARLGNTDTTNLVCNRNFFPAFDKFLYGSSNLYETVTNWNKRTNITDNLVGSITLDSTFKTPSASLATTLARPVAGVFEDYWGTARSQQAGSWVAGAVEGSY